MSYMTSPPPPYDANYETTNPPEPTKQQYNDYPMNQPGVPPTAMPTPLPNMVVVDQPLHGQQQPTTVVITEQQHPPTTVVLPEQPKSSQIFSDRPTTLPDGNVTIIRYTNGMFTYMAAMFICVFTMECCLCCLAAIPFCINATKDVMHIHPVTGEVVGYYRRLC